MLADRPFLVCAGGQRAGRAPDAPADWRAVQARKEVELPWAPIHGDYKLGKAGELPDGS